MSTLANDTSDQPRGRPISLRHAGADPGHHAADDLPRCGWRSFPATGARGRTLRPRPSVGHSGCG